MGENDMEVWAEIGADNGYQETKPPSVAVASRRGDST